LHALKSLPDESIDLVFADPPYNLSKSKGLLWRFSRYITLHESWDRLPKEDFLEFSRAWLAQCVRVLKPGGSLWICGTYHNIYQIGFLLHELHSEMRINNSIVWFKPNAMPNITRRMFVESCEHLIWASKKGAPWKFNYFWTKSGIDDRLNPLGKQTRNVWCIPVTPQSEKWAGRHPTQKPIELLRRILLASTDQADVILDPFAGSGTTAATALRFLRNSISIEQLAVFVAIAKRRLKKERRLFDNKATIIFKTTNGSQSDGRKKRFK
jgi:site-specific DNA-methyltransferase (adenine-specific)